MPAKPQPIQNEPFEIVEDAIDQITGSRSPQATEPSGAQSGSQTQPIQPGLDEKKKVAILTAHRRELDEITQLQKKRQEEMRTRWKPAEEKQPHFAEASRGKQEPQPLVEPTSKPKSGIFGGMQGALRKKQRSVELPKTPTN